MIIHVNHMGPGGSGPAAVDARAAEVVRTLLGLVATGHGDPRLLPSLRVHLDWIQYRANFREPILVRRAADRREDDRPWPRSPWTSGGSTRRP